MATRAARLGREVVAYVLGAPPSATSDRGAPSHAAIVGLSNPNASSPLAALRGTTPLPGRATFDVVASGDGTASLIVHADRVRPLIHVHTFHSPSQTSSASSSSCPLAARLQTPETMSALALSPCGTMLAAGAKESGRLYIWHLESGRLIVATDAHFRAVSCLQWTGSGDGLVSASDDGRVLVWSVEALLSASSPFDSEMHDLPKSANTMPYAILSDHVQGISAIALSSSTRAVVSSFPSSLRILSASNDGTVKLWDVRTRSLVATWAFSGPVKHLAIDVGFRSFFAAVTAKSASQEQQGRATAQDGDDDDDDESESTQQYDWIQKVDLFHQDASAQTSQTTSSAHSTRVQTNATTALYRANAAVRITALASSLTGSHLLVGTSNAHMITLDVASSVALRQTSLVAAGQTGASTADSTPHVEVLSLRTFLIEDASSLMQAASVGGKGGAGQRARGSAWCVAEKLDRVLHQDTNVGDGGWSTRLAQRSQHIDDDLQAITPPSLRAKEANASVARTSHTGEADAQGAETTRKRIAQLERDNEKLNDLLKRAKKTNADLWARLVSEAGAQGHEQSGSDDDDDDDDSSNVQMDE